MNRKTYNLILGLPIILFLLSSPLSIGFFIEIFNFNHWLALDSTFTFFITLIKTALAVSPLLLGLYFKTSIFTQNAKVIKPKWAISFGVLSTLMVIIPAFSSFYTLRAIKKEYPIITDVMIAKWKERALDNEGAKSNKRIFAKMYYNTTGEIIPYFNVDNEVMKFEPTSEEVIDRKYNIQQEKELNYTILTVNTIFYLKLIVVTTCVLIWLLSLKIYPPKNIKIIS